VLNALYPHLSRLFVEHHHKTGRQALIISSLIFSVGVIAALVFILIGPVLMAWLLGPGFDQAGALLSLMVWLIPLRLGNQALGFTLLLPAGRERQASVSMLICAGVSLLLGAIFALMHGAAGMVSGLLIGEVLLLLSQLFISKRVLWQDDR